MENSDLKKPEAQAKPWEKDMEYLANAVGDLAGMVVQLAQNGSIPAPAPAPPQKTDAELLAEQVASPAASSSHVSSFKYSVVAPPERDGSYGLALANGIRKETDRIVKLNAKK